MASGEETSDFSPPAEMEFEAGPVTTRTNIGLSRDLARSRHPLENADIASPVKERRKRDTSPLIPLPDRGGEGARESPKNGLWAVSPRRRAFVPDIADIADKPEPYRPIR